MSKPFPITIEGLGNYVNATDCCNRLLECRDWIDLELKRIFDNSNADIETKKLIADVASSLVLYTQECSTTIYNYLRTTTGDKINQ